MQGHKFFLTIVDDYSHFTWLFPMNAKSETRSLVINFIAYVENQFNTNVQTRRTVNGIEFAMENFFLTKGIIHKKSCVETPEKNGIVKRKHQHLLNITHALLFQANLPPIFWSFVAQHAALLINCTPTPFLNNATPYENFTEKFMISLVYSFLGAYVILTLLLKIEKAYSRASTGVFLGFKPNTKGYVFLNLKNHKTEISRHVIFYENRFPYNLDKESEK